MTITNKPNWKLTLGIPLCIFLACYIITLSPKFKLNPESLSTAIVLDLLITAPLAYYIAIRKSSVSKFTVLRVFIIGVLIAGLILNAGSSALLQFIKTWVAPVIEAFVIFFIAGKFYAANKRARLSGKNNVDFLVYSRMILGEVTGNEKAGNIIASEIGTIYYAFLSRKDKSIDNKSKFTSYKETGILLILGTFLSLFLVETAGVHFLLKLWNSTIAWTVTVLSLYTCIQLYAHIRAVKARPITFRAGTLEIYNGLAGEAIIRYDNIEKVELSDKTPIDREAIKISLLRKLEKHNCVIYLKQPIEVIRMFGIKKRADAVMFYVDSRKDFNDALDLILNFKVTASRL